MSKLKTIFFNSRRNTDYKKQESLTYKDSILPDNTTPRIYKSQPLAKSRKQQSNIKKETDMNEKLDNLVDNSHRILFTAKNVFPFDLFPDILTIDVNQVHLTTNYFLKTKRVHSIAIQDISDVFVETSPWYATLRIVDKDFIEKSVQISFLKKDDAMKAKKIIQGLMIGLKEGIDFSKITDDNLSSKLEDLGSPSSLSGDE